MKISELIRKLRVEKGITQEVLSFELETEQCNVSRWERGKYVPGPKNLIRLSEFFGVDLIVLVEATRLQYDVHADA